MEKRLYSKVLTGNDLDISKEKLSNKENKKHKH